jgi:hypothetical protein
MGVMAGYTNFVFQGVFDRLAGMGSLVQILNHILMATRTPIQTKKMFQRFVDLGGIGMELFSSNILVAFQA